MSMFGQAKPLASLSGGLLARKGGARPAMRPQGYASLAPTAQQLEDLGWNDMGPEPVLDSAPAPVPTITPLPAVEPVAEATVPPVLVEREALADTFEAPRVVRAVSVATAQRLERETAHKGRAAFTLRLDADRHLKLRLASALSHRSAQQLVSHALDQFLHSVPEVAALIAQLPETRSMPKKKARR